jgi:hypothetical protein
MLQRKCASCANSGSECAECRKKRTFALQPKLTINEPGDRYEQEADRITERVMRVSEPPAQRQPIPIKPLLVQRQTESSYGAGVDAPSIVHDALSSPGQPLDSATRAFFEPRFGHDFSHVRVHADAKAAESAQSVDALAYTVGRDVVFGTGQYLLGTRGGQKLLAHELAHVMQQSGIDGIRAGRSNDAPGLPKLQRQEAPAAAAAAPPQSRVGCPFSAAEFDEMLDRPLPWGTNAQSTPGEVAEKRREMGRGGEMVRLLNLCVDQPARTARIGTNYFIGVAANLADGISLRELLEGWRSGREFRIQNRRVGDQTLETWINPQALPGGLVIGDPRHVVSGPDLRAQPGEARALGSPQCGDECTEAAQRRLTKTKGKWDWHKAETVVRSCCTRRHCDTIAARIATAAEHADRALQRLRQRRMMDSAMERHFDASDETTQLFVEEALRRIRPDITFASHLWICRNRGHDEEACPQKGTGSIGGEAKGHRILLCFERGDIEWDSVLHEIVHGGNIGHMSPAKEVYRNDPEYPPANAIRNADSYAAFVKEVGAADWSEEGPPMPKEFRILGGLRKQQQETRPLLAMRFEVTPLGPGLRTVDLALGGTAFWLPKTQSFSRGGGATADVSLRLLAPPRALVFDIGTGANFTYTSEEGGQFAALVRAAATWRIGGVDSRWAATVDFNAMYDKAQLEPDSWLVGVSIGRRWDVAEKTRRQRLGLP